VTKVISFTGVHNTGKTTLRNAVYDELQRRGKNAQIFEFSVTEVSKKCAVDCGVIQSGESRRQLQEAILSEWFETLVSYTESGVYDYIVCDRCPIDFMIYPNMESSAEVSNDNHQRWLYEYNKACRRYMDLVDYTFLTPLVDFINIEYRESRGDIAEAYMQGCDFMARGILSDVGGHIIRERSVEDRVDEVFVNIPYIPKP